MLVCCISVCLAGATLLLGGASAPAQAGEAAWPAGPAVPDVAGNDIRTEPAGWYELRYGSGQAIPAYWMPRGSFSDVPAEVGAHPAYPAVVAQADSATIGVIFRNDGIVEGLVSDAERRSRGATESAPPESGLGDDGLVVAASWPFTTHCTQGALCLYEHNDFNGDFAWLVCCNDWFRLSNTGVGNDRVSSWINFRAHDSLLSEHWPPGGTIKCLQQNDYRGNLFGFNDEASGARRTQIASQC